MAVALINADGGRADKHNEASSRFSQLFAKVPNNDSIAYCQRLIFFKKLKILIMSPNSLPLFP
jgi:hypothetical protein